MVHLQEEQTIIAQCTPSGNGALALLRLSGADALRVADAMAQLSSGKKLVDVPSHTVHHGTLVDAQATSIDEVMFIVMHAPRTFTGQTTVEITCHNNPFIIESIITQAIIQGARLAQPGEFAERAYKNKKIDLLQAEAINDLIHAQTPLALKHSLAQLQGSLSQWVVALEKELVKALAWTEASFEFLDDDGDFGLQIKEQLCAVQNTIAHIKKSFDAQKQIRQGFRIAFIGSVNAGKSSLFNAILQQKRAIVSDTAGTTRDSIEAGLYKNGTYWTLVDTAGLRQTADSIEQEGIRRSYEEAHAADCIILVYDKMRVLTTEEAQIYNDICTKYPTKIISVYNKCDDAIEKSSDKNVYVSTHTGFGILELEATIQDHINALAAQTDSPFLLNKRHMALLVRLETKISEIIVLLSQEHIHYELVSYHLRDALEELSSLTGKSISEAGMDAVFREFCVGK